jgi:ribosomal-protein-alanine N-acetyltransferase|tara:strand:- start:459 stop:950 length:492 start_codon:yes stop_codon:yes gene_type:complete
MVINTERFKLKTLTVDDATEEYLSWFSSSKEVGEYIAYAKINADIHKLRQYVKEREDREDVLFLGIFTDSGQHIGNIKYEPINLKDQSATMGILIGNKEWRGKGVATEVIKDSGKYLKDNYKIKYIDLGVNKDNIAAVSAYKKMKFKVIKKTDLGFMMRLNIE